MTNDHINWEEMYAMYAGVIYGSIIKLTDNKAIAEKLLCLTFVRLKEDDFFKRSGRNTHAALIKYTNLFSLQLMPELLPSLKKDKEPLKMFYDGK